MGAAGPTPTATSRLAPTVGVQMRVIPPTIMAITILETLQNAQHNLGPTGAPFARKAGYDQLNNAVTLLEKGYDLYDEVEPILENYGDVESVPDKG